MCRSWWNFDNETIRPLTDDSLGSELYDHRGDTSLWIDFPGENENLVHKPEHAALVRELHQALLDYIRL